MMNGFLDQFPLPEEAQKALSGMKQNQIGDGVSIFSGHDQGVGYRFYSLPEYNKHKSDIAKYEVFPEVDMIEWFADKFNRPVERVKLLPPELLALDEDGNCVGGAYADAYRRYKEGKSAAGTPLAKWGVLSDGQVASLSAKRVYTVEQFAAMPKGKLVGIYPQEFIEAWERANQYVNGKEGREASQAQTQELIRLAEESQRKDAVIAEMQQQLKSLMGLHAAAEVAPKKRIRRSKAQIEADLVKE